MEFTPYKFRQILCGSDKLTFKVSLFHLILSANMKCIKVKSVLRTAHYYQNCLPGFISNDMCRVITAKEGDIIVEDWYKTKAIWAQCLGYFVLLVQQRSHYILFTKKKVGQQKGSLILFVV